ncbi:MAG: hypothetical protein AB3N63_14020 [Puniceicoccaceae bacterium]
MRHYLLSLCILIALSLNCFGKGSIKRGGSISKEEFQSVIEHCETSLPKLWNAMQAVKNQDVEIRISGEKMSGPGKVTGPGLIVLSSRFLTDNIPAFPEDRLIIVLYHEFGHVVFNRNTPRSKRNPEKSEFAAFSYSLIIAKKMALAGDYGPLEQVTMNLVRRQKMGNQRKTTSPHNAALNELIGNELWNECIAILDAKPQ